MTALIAGCPGGLWLLKHCVACHLRRAWWVGAQAAWTFCSVSPARSSGLLLDLRKTPRQPEPRRYMIGVFGSKAPLAAHFF